MRRGDFQPGFRLSITDIAVLILAGIGAIALGRAEFWLGVAVWRRVNPTLPQWWENFSPGKTMEPQKRRRRGAEN